ncbi:MAG TPA: FG-GAP-like repeat-containing protein [Candidatus Didemnitutus sp.]|nr:FG-GAP-like repeat-containing protein [Candidatus Didemnitutus sp.]
MFNHTTRICFRFLPFLAILVLTGLGLEAATATAQIGRTVTFSVSATGTAPFTYQWYKNGTALSGATSPSYQIASVQASSAGTYTVKVSNAYGSTLSDSGVLAVGTGPVAGDLNGDGVPDLVWQNSSTGDFAIWTLQNLANTGNDPYLARLPATWRIVGRADFNGDGNVDLVWENTATGDHAVWFMNGTTFNGSTAYLGYVPAPWRIGAVADMDGDGHPDLVWENTSTGDRAIWYMNGATILRFGYLAYVDPAWRLCGAADFNGDGHADLAWECTASSGGATVGDHIAWLMDDEDIVSFADLGTASPAWHLAAIADFTGDGQPDLLWEDTVAGDANAGARVVWEMNGTTFTGRTTTIATVDVAWKLAP